MFKDDGFLIKYENADFYLSAGESVVNGLYFSNNTDLLLTVPALPNTAWLDVWQERNMTGVLNRFNVVYNDGSDMPESIENGELHKYIKLAVVNSTVSIDDQRLNVTDSFSLYHKGNIPSASTSAKGVVQLSDSVTSTSSAMAATAKSVKSAYDLANTKASGSHSHNESDLPSASTTVKGVAQLSDSVTSTSSEMAATPKAVKEAYDKAVESSGAETVIHGSNSNGYYSKFSSGTLICYSRENSGGATTNFTWTYPHAFVDDTASVQTNVINEKYWKGTALYIGASSVELAPIRGSIQVTSIEVAILAVGRWK
jgi:hypothetical protein